MHLCASKFSESLFSSGILSLIPSTLSPGQLLVSLQISAWVSKYFSQTRLDPCFYSCHLGPFHSLPYGLSYHPVMTCYLLCGYKPFESSSFAFSVPVLCLEPATYQLPINISYWIEARINTQGKCLLWVILENCSANHLFLIYPTFQIWSRFIKATAT